MSAQRTITAAVMAPLVIAALLLLSTPYVAAICAALFLCGLWEWSRLVGIKEPVPRAFYLTANIAMMAALAWGGRPLFGMIALVGVCWWLLATFWLLRVDFGRDGNGWSRALKLAAGTLSIIPAWCALVLLHYGTSTPSHVDASGPRWALLALGIVWAADSGAYFTGVRWGRKKMIPHISPGKTWVGLWGGAIAAVAVGLAGAKLLVGMKPAQLPLMAVLVLITVAASVIGDLFESLMKRHSGCKDSGTLIPGHGGVLDRIDSVLAALPVLWIAKGWLDL
jgi:phosphatidate cytidylyltransferase